jgi:hypothetical protein
VNISLSRVISTGAGGASPWRDEMLGLLELRLGAEAAWFCGDWGSPPPPHPNPLPGGEREQKAAPAASLRENTTGRARQHGERQKKAAPVASLREITTGRPRPHGERVGVRGHSHLGNKTTGRPRHHGERQKKAAPDASLREITTGRPRPHGERVGVRGHSHLGNSTCLIEIPRQDQPFNAPASPWRGESLVRNGLAKAGKENTAFGRNLQPLENRLKAGLQRPLAGVNPLPVNTGFTPSCWSTAFRRNLQHANANYPGIAPSCWSTAFRRNLLKANANRLAVNEEAAPACWSTAFRRNLQPLKNRLKAGLQRPLAAANRLAVNQESAPSCWSTAFRRNLQHADANRPADHHETPSPSGRISAIRRDRSHNGPMTTETVRES